jgi:hypothetical protein
MTDENKERWMEVCELAAKEQDDEKFSELIFEVSRLLKERDDRATGRRPVHENPSPDNRSSG